MDSITVDVDGLTALAGVCHREGEMLSVGQPVPQAGPSFQATTAAVNRVVDLVGRADGLISVRLRVTGHKIAAAADRLARCDAKSSDQIASVGEELTVT